MGSKKQKKLWKEIVHQRVLAAVVLGPTEYKYVFITHSIFFLVFQQAQQLLYVENEKKKSNLWGLE